MPPLGKEVASMRRILLVMAVAAMMVASALPAFADKGAQGHNSFKETASPDSVTSEFTNSGKTGNFGEPGRSSSTVTDFPSAEGDEIGQTTSTTRQGRMGGGGGRITFDLASTAEREEVQRDITCHGSDFKGSGCP